MDFIQITFGRRRLLLVQPQESSYGKVLGFGALIRNVDEALEVARQRDAMLFLVQPSNPMNRALFDITSPQVRTVRQGSGQARLLTALWHASAPFRRRAPGAWFKRALARLLRPALNWVVSSTRGWNKRRHLDIKGVAAPALAWTGRATESYARQIATDWRTAVSEAGKRHRKAARKGQQPPLQVAVPERRLSEIRARLRDLGLAADSRIVTLHIRESGYRLAQGFRQRDHDDVRNATVESYFESIDYLASRGFTIVRVGDSTMTPMERAGLIDLATSPLRDDWTEFWCLQHSEFLIASDSGPFFWSQLLGMPRLAVNQLQFGAGGTKATDRYVPKLPVDRESGHRLSLSEMLTEPFMRFGRDPARYAYLDNSSEDLVRAVEEMADIIQGIDERSPAQLEFERLFSEITRVWRPEWDGRWSVIAKRERAGTVSRSFADRYLHATS